MPEMKVAVIIATRNRSRLLRNAISSALAQTDPEPEVVVIDDNSSDDTPDVIRNEFPQVRYLRQQDNTGPGPARMIGLEAATSGYALILDDDDILYPGALSKITEQIGKQQSAQEKPAFFFRSSQGTVVRPFSLIGVRDLLNGAVAGELVPILNRNVFLAEGYSYPAIKVGGEGLLWLEIAADCGIPTWDIAVTQRNEGAPGRLTSVDNQIVRAREYAELQDTYLTKFGVLLAHSVPEELRRRRIGSVVYWLLAGERKRAAARARASHLDKATRWALLLAGFVPGRLLKRFFRWYRQIAAHQALRRLEDNNA